MTSRATWVAGLVLVVLVGAGFALHGAFRGTQTAVHGLTLAAMVFLVASGLSLVFGLMNVLNLAHGAIFMVGAYCAAVAISNPEALALVVAYPMGLAAGLFAGPLLGRAARSTPLARVPRVAWGLLAAAGFAAAALIWLINVPTAIFLTVFPELELSEALAVSLVMVSGLIGSIGLSLAKAPSGQATTGNWLWPWAPLAIAALVLASTAEAIGDWFRELPSNPQYALAVIIGTAVGAGLGLAMESGLLKRLYSRHLTQVIMTFFILILLVQAVQVLFGRNTLSMPRPDAFDQSTGACTDAGLWTAVTNGCSSFTLMGAQAATYRLVIILAAVFCGVAVAALLRYSRTGMHIRAGVQDPEMVAALGVDVERVFRRTFVLGSALAAFGGAVAAPFLGANSSMALVFLIDATVVLLIGGLGSIGGAVFGALVLGLWTALSDITVLEMGLDPAVTRVSVLLLFVVVLMIRPQGVFGGGRA